MLTRIESEAPTVEADRSVGSIVRPVAVTAPPTATLRQAAEQMTANDVGLVVVTRAGSIIGVLSERDIVRSLAEGLDADDERVADQMVVEVVSVGATAPIGEAARLMAEGGIRHLPVVDGHRVAGVISIRDVFPTT